MKWKICLTLISWIVIEKLFFASIMQTWRISSTYCSRNYLLYMLLWINTFMYVRCQHNLKEIRIIWSGILKVHESFLEFGNFNMLFFIQLDSGFLNRSCCCKCNWVTHGLNKKYALKQKLASQIITCIHIVYHFNL